MQTISSRSSSSRKGRSASSRVSTCTVVVAPGKTNAAKTSGKHPSAARPRSSQLSEERRYPRDEVHAAVRSRQQLLPYDVLLPSGTWANLTQVMLKGYMGMHPPS